MGHFLDNEEDMLMKALDAAKDYSRKSQENREKQLWRKLDILCTLLDALNGLTKSDMDEIRKNLDLKNLSTLKKSELATELSGLLPGRYGQVLHLLDQGEYGLIKEIARRGGFIQGDMELSRVEALVGYGLVFPCVYKEQRGLFMPQELVDAFMQADGTELQNTVARNTEWVLLTQGMLYYYGVMDILAAQSKIEEFTSQKVDLMEYLRVLDVAIDSYGLIRKTMFGFQDDRVFDAKKVMEEHQSRPDVDYFPFSKKQLLKAGNVGFIDRTLAMNDFISFLTRYYELKEDDIDEIAYQMIYMINSDAKSELMLQYLQSWFEFPSLEFTNQLMSVTMTLHNCTRLWVLKGHTPDELFQKEKKFLKPLPLERFPMEKPVSSVADSISSMKTGRNDPCPCGSGKKYKKCCGSNH
jgi:Predicted metal-binding protein related to the C-terminal domain of SecA